MVSKEQLTLREATSDDCQLLFDWVNDEVVRKNSINSKIIDWETHCQWFKNMMHQPEHKRIFIAEEENHQPVGVIRFEKKSNKAYIGYSIDKKYRNKKLGSPLLSLGVEKICESWQDIDAIVGIVKPDNISSVKIFEQNGFRKTDKTSTIEYHKSL